MKKTIRKVTAALLGCGIVSASFCALPVSAESNSTTASNEGYTDFSKDWSGYWEFDCGGEAGKMGSATIGFNERTLFPDQDYIKQFGTLANQEGKYKYVKVKNSQGTTAESDHYKYTYANFFMKASVNHTGSSVTYYAYWNCES